MNVVRTLNRLCLRASIQRATTKVISHLIRSKAPAEYHASPPKLHYFDVFIPRPIRSDICFIMPDISPIILDIFCISSGVIFPPPIMPPMSPIIPDMPPIILPISFVSSPFIIP